VKPAFSLLRLCKAPRAEPRLQCDENKPRCKQCTAYGVFCNYDCKYSDLQLSVDRAFKIELLQRPPYSLNQTIASNIVPTLRPPPTASLESNAVYLLRERDLELLSKFQMRTALTISTEKSLHIYQNEVVRLAFSVRTLSSCPASNADIGMAASILNACGTVLGTKA
jgi:hypothetical protein